MKHGLLGTVAMTALAGACAPHSVDLGNDPTGGGSGGAASGGTGGTLGGTAGTGNAGSGALGGRNGQGGSGGSVGGQVSGGASNSGGTQTSSAVCGDGIVEGDELCDDGNGVSGDGCDDNCFPEPGFSCTQGLICSPICGDGIVAGGEQCDDGNLVDDDGCPNDCGRTFPVDCSGVGDQPSPPAEKQPPRPCDIYAADGGPCVAAHSTVRALYATYLGPLYQLKKSDGATQDIRPRPLDGFADTTTHAAFCAGSACTIAIIYDQSGHGNHLTAAPPGGAKPTPGNEANANAVSATFAGQKVYGVHIVPGVAYRNNQACGTATGDDPETMYMVVAGDFYNGGCCFDYGNVERKSTDDGEGTAEAVYFGSTTIWGKGEGVGPWVMGDLENGLWAGDTSPYEASKSLKLDFVTAMLKGDGPGKNHWTLKSGDAQSNELTIAFDGPRPSVRYNPMRKEGAISLGAAGDNSNAAQGNFFEGVMTTQYSSDDADADVQLSIASVYGAR
jgi:cysteine-rich repeat protein